MDGSTGRSALHPFTNANEQHRAAKAAAVTLRPMVFKVLSSLMKGYRILIACLPALTSCVRQSTRAPVPQPRIIPHSAWEATPPVGYAADATRRNKAPGDSLAFHELRVNVLNTRTDSTAAKPVDI